MEGEENVPRNFDAMLASYLVSTCEVVKAVMMVSVHLDPHRYAAVAELVESGRLVATIVGTADTMTISLVDAATGKTIGDLFRYTAPALAAGGVPN